MAWRITDDDNTASLIHDRQFYVNHEADYASHELQAFFDIGDSISVTSGIFFYQATIDQRGDFYSSVGEDRMRLEYEDNTVLSLAAATAIGASALAGISASDLAFAGAPMVNLFSARTNCKQAASPAASCTRNNFGVNVATSKWWGDDGSDDALNVIHGPDTIATDLLYTTQTKRDAFAAYTQGVWDISELFTVTLGVRYARDKVRAEENLFRYSETGGNPGGFLDLFGGLAAVNRVNGGLVDDGSGNLIVPTEKVTNGGIPFALSVYRPFDRTDDKVTFRANLDWNINDSAMMYFSATRIGIINWLFGAVGM